MPAKIPQEVREKQLNSLPGKRFVRWLDGYQDRNSKAVMRCSDGHEWAASINNLVNNSRGCPTCAGNQPYSAADREAQLKLLPRASFVRWEIAYTNKRSKAVMKCDDGHEWSASVDRLVNGACGCPTCAGNQRVSSEKREQQLNRIPGVSFVKWEGGDYQNGKSKAVMSCDAGHQWAAAVTNLLRGNGCPKCVGKYCYSTEERERQLNSIEGAKFVRWATEYKNQKSKAVMKCDVGHEWSASVDDLLRGTRCPSCAKYGFDIDSNTTLYALRSECGGHLKIGITGHLDQRLIQLERATPFEFSVVALVRDKGRKVRALEKMFHKSFDKSGFSGFNGASEWLKFDSDILDRLRSLSD